MQGSFRGKLLDKLAHGKTHAQTHRNKRNSECITAPQARSTRQSIIAGHATAMHTGTRIHYIDSGIPLPWPTDGCPPTRGWQCSSLPCRRPGGSVFRRLPASALLRNSRFCTQDSRLGSGLCACLRSRARRGTAQQTRSVDGTCERAQQTLNVVGDTAIANVGYILQGERD